LARWNFIEIIPIGISVAEVMMAFYSKEETTPTNSKVEIHQTFNLKFPSYGAKASTG